ncbi:MAG: hypothetical protein IPP79_05000 [Chitinophagaceae bacterium]|nr:hypothetical protein [Chitinophagaceae bacterium]
MATYTSTGTAVDASLNLLPLGTNERYIYGSSRLGMERWYVTTDGNQLYDMRWYSGNTFRRGYKNYELSNHLGNVLATISDKKKGVPLAHSSLIDYFEADLQTAQDYYPFGMLMPHRSYASTANYRFGFNGKENDNESKGLGNQQDYGMRVYDTRIGRFLSVDPITKDYPQITPYQYASDRPIDGLDFDGLEFLVQTIIRSLLDFL